MNNNQGGGLLGGLLMGAGFTMLLALPFLLTRLILKHFGTLGTTIFFAVMLTIMAIYVPGYAASIVDGPVYGKMGEANYQMAAALNDIPIWMWWTVAGLSWVMVALLIISAKGQDDSLQEEIAK